MNGGFNLGPLFNRSVQYCRSTIDTYTTIDTFATAINTYCINTEEYYINKGLDRCVAILRLRFTCFDVFAPPEINEIKPHSQLNCSHTYII